MSDKGAGDPKFSQISPIGNACIKKFCYKARPILTKDGSKDVIPSNVPFGV